MKGVQIYPSLSMLGTNSVHIEWRTYSGSPSLNVYVWASHPTAPDSNPEHNIYAF